jgi:hypothetical protein
VKKDASVGNEEDSLSELLRDMFITILLLNGVTQDSVATIVRVSKTRVNAIGKNLKLKRS